MNETTIESSRPPPPLVGPPVVEFGRYRVRQRLGSGGMGTVYAAYDPSLDREVALKVLFRSKLGPERAPRLIREARTLARLAHPNVVQVYDVGVVHDDVFIAMELVHGVSLDQWLRATTHSWRDALAVFLQAGRALAAAHAAGLVHRNFKPENCLLGDDGRTRVLDFGLARPSPSGARSAALRHPAPPFDGISISDLPGHDWKGAGTPAYISPEQFANAEITAKSDQFAFCVAMWQALLGTHPFPRSSLTGLAFAVRFGAPPQVPERHDVPDWVLNLLRIGLSVEPRARHDSMESLLAPLQDGLAVLRPREPQLGWRYELAGDRARDRVTGRTLHVERAAAPVAPEVLERLLGLRHPNLARPLDVVFSRGVHLLLDLPETTEPLDAFVGRPPELVAPYLTQARRALSYLHEKGLVHGNFSGACVRVNDGHAVLAGLSACVVGDPGDDLRAFDALSRSLLGHDSPAIDPPQLETAETRESLLQTIALRGRDDEWATLVAALQRSFAGRPTVTFVTGESGVGKSRLSTDLAAHAKARRAVVLAGSCREGAAAPFTLFRDVLSGLALLTPLLDEEASTFGLAVPQLGALLDRNVTVSRETDAATACAKLVSAMLSVLERTRDPVVVLLDDVHWARAESLELLAGLSQAKEGTRLAVVATLREREHLAMLPGDVVRLRRLDADAVRAVTCDVLGAERTTAELLRSIERETEGNPFLLIEALRTLGERPRAPDGRDLRSDELPPGVGTERALAARVARVAAEDRDLLELAAVAGRELDRALLAALRPDLDVQASVERLRNAGVVEFVDERYQFGHDKLREAVEAALPPARARELHRQVAGVLWQQQGDTAAPSLYLHHARAGNSEGERRFAELAGLLASRTSKADARVYFERAAELETDPLERARLHRHAGQACYSLADFDATNKHLSQALTLLDVAVPSSLPGWLWFLAKQALVQASSRVFGHGTKNDPARQEASLSAGRLAKLWAHRPVPIRLVSLALLAVNLGERAGLRNTYALAILGYAAGLLGMRKLQASYFAEAAVGAEPTPEQVEASVMETMYLGATGQRLAAIRVSDRGLALARRCGDHFGAASVQAARAHAMWFFGHVGEMSASFARALGEFDSTEHGHRPTFLIGHALGLLLDGNVGGALAAGNEALTRLSRLDDSIRASGLAVLCLARVELGRVAEAACLVDEIESLLPRGDLVAPVFFHVPMACVEARLLQNDPVKIRAALAYEKAWVKNSPLGEAQWHLHRGKQLRRLGRESAARRRFERGRRRAVALGTPVYEALCLVELGETDRAVSLFEAASAGLYQQRLRDIATMRQLKAVVSGASAGDC